MLDRCGSERSVRGLSQAQEAALDVVGVLIDHVADPYAAWSRSRQGCARPGPMSGQPKRASQAPKKGSSSQLMSLTSSLQKVRRVSPRQRDRHLAAPTHSRRGAGRPPTQARQLLDEDGTHHRAPNHRGACGAPSWGRPSRRDHRRRIGGIVGVEVGSHGPQEGGRAWHHPAASG